jgi:hypothetical protein
MSTTEIIVLVGIAVGTVIAFNFYDRGKKALAIFPDIKMVTVVYRDRTATGYSTRSWKTRVGGANRSLEVVVTDSELWLKSFVLLAGIAQQHDLIHRVRLTSITKVKEEGTVVKLDFKNERGQPKQVVINTRSPADFMNAIKGK